MMDQYYHSPLPTFPPSWTSQGIPKTAVIKWCSTIKILLLVGDLDGYVHVINPMTGITVGRKKVSGTQS